MKLNINGIPFEMPDAILAMVNPHLVRKANPESNRVNVPFAMNQPLVEQQVGQQSIEQAFLKRFQESKGVQEKKALENKEKEGIYKAIISMDERLGKLEDLVEEKKLTKEETEEEEKFQKELKKTKEKSKKK